jgi:hypothetical protein
MRVERRGLCRIRTFMERKRFHRGLVSHSSVARIPPYMYLSISIIVYYLSTGETSHKKIPASRVQELIYCHYSFLAASAAVLCCHKLLRRSSAFPRALLLRRSDFVPHYRRAWEFEGRKLTRLVLRHGRRAALWSHLRSLKVTDITPYRYFYHANKST